MVFNGDVEAIAYRNYDSDAIAKLESLYSEIKMSRTVIQ